MNVRTAWPTPLRYQETCSVRIQRTSFRASGSVKQTIARPSRLSTLWELTYGRRWNGAETATAITFNHRLERYQKGHDVQV